MYELIIIGGGPPGAAAAVYAARKQIKTLLVTDSFGGQSIDSERIENWIGTIAISGLDLAKTLKEHAKHYAEEFVDIKEAEKVNKILKLEKAKENEEKFSVVTSKSEYKTKAILIATGSSRRKLEVPGAKKFEGKGLTYCASCDGPFFADKDVVVVGGGNAGFESAAQLLAYCKSVILLARGEFKADEVTIKKALENPKFKGITNAVPTEIKSGSGGQFLDTLVYKKTAPFAQDNIEIKTEGIFVEIGSMPTTYFAEGIVEMNTNKNIMVDPKTQKTSEEGIWAAGDCTDGLYHQNNIAAGDAVKALENIYLELHNKR